MLVERDSMFTLSNEPGSLGLSCDNEGIALAGVPLLRRTETGFVPRAEAEIEQLVGSAYGNTDEHSSVFAGLGVAARALSAGDLVRAMIAAVQLTPF